MGVRSFHMGGFKGMKASKVVLGKIQYPCYISPKIDGIRCHAFPGGGVKSCTLKDIANTHIRDNIRKITQEFFTEDIVDGEILSGDTFQDCQSFVMSRDGEPEFTYHIFDCVRGGTNIFSFKERYEYLCEKIQIINKKYPEIQLVEAILVHNEAELLAKYEEYVSMGYEGAMLRAPKAFYKYGRSTVKEGYLLKLKPMESSEAVIVGFVEGYSNNNEASVDALGRSKRTAHSANLVPKNTLGTFKVRDLYNEDWEFEIGTGKGLTHALRKEIWDGQSDYLGKIITYEYQAIGTKDKPRIPIFKGFREDDDLRCDY